MAASTWRNESGRRAGQMNGNAIRMKKISAVFSGEKNGPLL
jgi:hypothetical protein